MILNPFLLNQHFCGFYSVQRQTILLVNGVPLGQERVKLKFLLCLSAFELLGGASTGEFGLDSSKWNINSDLD